MPGNLHGKQKASPIPTLYDCMIIIITVGCCHAWKPAFLMDGTTNSEHLQAPNNDTHLCT
jgi:hypothetical protein